MRSKVFCLLVSVGETEVINLPGLVLLKTQSQRNVCFASQLSLPSNSAIVAAVLSHHKLCGAFLSVAPECFIVLPHP